MSGNKFNCFLVIIGLFTSNYFLAFGSEKPLANTTGCLIYDFVKNIEPNLFTAFIPPSHQVKMNINDIETYDKIIAIIIENLDNFDNTKQPLYKCKIINAFEDNFTVSEADFPPLKMYNGGDYLLYPNVNIGLELMLLMSIIENKKIAVKNNNAQLCELISEKQLLRLRNMLLRFKIERLQNEINLAKGEIHCDINNAIEASVFISVINSSMFPFVIDQTIISCIDELRKNIPSPPLLPSSFSDESAKNFAKKSIDIAYIKNNDTQSRITIIFNEPAIALLLFCELDNTSYLQIYGKMFAVNTEYPANRDKTFIEIGACQCPNAKFVVRLKALNNLLKQASEITGMKYPQVVTNSENAVSYKLPDIEKEQLQSGKLSSKELMIRFTEEQRKKMERQ